MKDVEILSHIGVQEAGKIPTIITHEIAINLQPHVRSLSSAASNISSIAKRFFVDR